MNFCVFFSVVSSVVSALTLYAQLQNHKYACVCLCNAQMCMQNFAFVFLLGLQLLIVLVIEYSTNYSDVNNLKLTILALLKSNGNLEKSKSCNTGLLKLTSQVFISGNMVSRFRTCLQHIK